MARELFVYWKAPLLHAATAIDAAQAMQAALVAAHPGLQAHLFQRADEVATAAAADADANTGTVTSTSTGTGTGTGTVTVMETYAVPADRRAGVDTALQATIAAAARTALAGLPVGTRHVEVFDRLPR